MNEKALSGALTLTALTALPLHKGGSKSQGFFTCITSQLIYCISCHKCPGVVYIGETGRSLSDHFWLDVIKKKVALPILQEWTTSWRTSK